MCTFVTQKYTRKNFKDNIKKLSKNSQVKLRNCSVFSFYLLFTKYAQLEFGVKILEETFSKEHFPSI